MKNNSNTIKISRYFLVSIVFLFVIILTRLLYVATFDKVDGINLNVFASKRNTKKMILYANRGTIYDTNGDILAQNVNSYTVIAFLDESRTSDSSNPNHVVDKNYTAKMLSPLINMSEEAILKLLNKDVYQVELGPGGRGITELLKDKIEDLDLPGIGFISSSKRWYKMGDFASYIVGYAKKNDNDEISGEMGIEKAYNKILKGKNGYTKYQRDAYGYQIPNTPSYTSSPESGNDIYLTIDNNIQILLENAIDKFESEYKFSWLTFTIANAKTGAIVASSTIPSFDPNVLDIENYMVPLTQYTYEPGSTMKVFSFMAAMENGVYNGSETYKSGRMTIGKYTISDFNDVGFGTITFDQGFGYSSNIAAANLAKKLKKNQLKDFYKKLGFGTKTGVELGDEYTGKLDFKYEVEVANAAFGQGLTTTPIQNIQALTSLTNNGEMLKPYLIDKVVDVSNKKIVYEGKRTVLSKVASEITVNKMKELMKSVIYGGFSQAYLYAPDNITLIGKTGTAQIASSTGSGYMKGPYNYIKSFAGIFPYEDPEYIIYVSVKQLEAPYGGLPSLVKKVVEDIAQTKSITENKDSLDETKIITVKSYLSKKMSDIEQDINNNSLKSYILGDGNYIVDQYPYKGNVVSYNSKLFLLTNSKKFTMPDITGWSLNEVESFCKLIGLKYNVDGYGYVTSYSILKDTVIDLNSEINIVLQPLQVINTETIKEE